MVSSSKKLSSKSEKREFEEKKSLNAESKDNPAVLASWRISSTEFAVITEDGVISFVDVGED